ncbi:hypothetical protein KMZ29_05135 [Bradyrhizobium sediminis]|uniref:Uncharacterized protein n=1 Tax=Bradyrhizobium sediminis TaxID=2840469 RepID=A0A975RPC9_9BRAD|nr:hypothetical protein [Bradyrhizobium sediminis]QWG15657.1 hypothetical protein KMZ29_05135 [Bradyrhizobium sediminis]
MKKYLTKFAVDILPSVAATVIGAYIVNHFIVAKPSADTPAAVVSTAVPEVAKADAKASATTSAATTSAKASPKAPEASSDLANVRGPGVTAKGISEKAILEKTAAEKPAENIVEKPMETAAIPVEPRRHQPAPREKTVAKSVPAPAPAVAPVVSAPATPPPADAASAADERRDANDLARAAIDRLRGSNEASPRVQEAARAPEAVRIPDAPRVAPAVRPLPPPIMVSAPPPNEALDAQAGSSPRPPYGATRSDDPGRPTPPAEIPSRPLDLRAEAAEPAVRERTTVAEDVLSAAKSVFHAVLPK